MDGAGFDLGQVDARPGELLERADQGAGLVDDAEGEAGLVGCLGSPAAGRLGGVAEASSRTSRWKRV